MTQPTEPIELNGTHHRLPAAAPLPDGFLEALGAACPAVTDVTDTANASRDWWPLALHWALRGEVLQRAAVVARPTSTAEVSAVLRLCNEHRVPVTPAGGRSSVVGATVPVFGGVLLDLCGLQGVASVDTVSGLVEVWAGTFGPDLEHHIRTHHGLTVGH
ncbi:MAG: hypothetical protein RLZ14_738, partial [Actinomycetota bacterium]